MDVSEFELCVLSRDDVDIAISESGRTGLWDKIRVAGAESLAAKPTTLAMLISLAENRMLPSTRKELYEQGLLKLCEQTDERRDRAVAESAIPSPDECLAIAERIAGRLLLTGQSMMTRLRDRDDAIHYDRLQGGNFASAGQSRVEITKSKVRQIVEHTALFSGRTEGLYGFAHRSFGEFLAARYLKGMFSDAQIDAMIHVESEGVHKIVPQLNEVAAWLADMDDGFRGRILRADPTIILRSDLSSRSCDEKQQVAGTLLQAVQAGQIYHLEDALGDGSGGRMYGVVRQLLERLACPELAGVVRPWIIDKSRSEWARHLAIDIAWFAKCSELSTELTTVALDPTETTRLRHGAGYAIMEMGNDADKERFRPLLMLSEKDDPEDQLKGIALRALWPDRLTPLQMLRSLTPRREPNFLGSYGGFLYGIKDMGILSDADLPEALVWAKGVEEDLGAGSDVGNIAGMVAYEGWQRIDRPGVLDPLADLVVNRMLHHRCFMTTPKVGKCGGWPSEYERACILAVGEDVVRRRILLKACLERIGPKQTHFLINTGMGGTMAIESDFEWAIERCLRSSGKLAERFAELAKSLCVYAGVGPWRNPAHVDLWLRAREESEVIRTVMAWPVVVELGSELERSMKKEWIEHKKWELRADRRRRREEASRVKPVELLQELARKASEEDIRFLPGILQALQLGEDGQWKSFEDPTESYAWQNAEEVDRRLTLSACVRYLADVPVPDHVGAEDDGTLLSGWAALGLVLLAKAGPELLRSELSAERIRALTPHLIDGLNRAVSGRSQASPGVDFFWERCPNETTQALLAVLLKHSQAEYLPRVVYALPDPFPDTLGRVLLEAAIQRHADQKIGPELLAFLVAHEVPGALEFAVGRATSGAESEDEWKVRRAWLGAVVRAKSERVWPELKALADRSARWANETMRAVVNARRFNNDRAAFQDGLSDEQLAELAQILFKHFDPQGDKRKLGADRVSDSDEVRWWRGQVLNTLVSRGSATTVQALRELSRAHPDHDWLKHYVLEATTQARRHAWTPPTITQLTEMEADAQRRLVRSGSELLSVVDESLRAWASELRRDDLVRSLWDQRDDKSWKPKDEEHLSQTLAAWLKRDLKCRCVTAGRELQLSKRSLPDGQAGTRVDIDLVAIKDGEHWEPIRSVVEVKGNWHNQVKSAMQSQLVDRYFAEGRYLYGLYLVGWYNDAVWCSPAQAQAELDAQVHQLNLPSSEAVVMALVVDCSLS